MDHRGKVQRPFNAHFQARVEHPLEGLLVFVGRRVDVFDEKLRKVGGHRHGNHPGVEQIRRGERVGVENREASLDIRDELVGFPVVGDVVAKQPRVFLLQLQPGQFVVFLEDLGGTQKLPLGRGGHLKTPGRLQLAQLLEDPVGPGLFGVAEDVKAAQPAGERKPDEQEDENRPQKEVVPTARRGFFVVIVVVTVGHFRETRGAWPSRTVEGDSEPFGRWT